eukprot:gene27485-4793_t
MAFVYQGAGKKQDPNSPPEQRLCARLAILIQRCLARNGSNQAYCKGSVAEWQECVERVKKATPANSAATCEGVQECVEHLNKATAANSATTHEGVQECVELVKKVTAANSATTCEGVQECVEHVKETAAANSAVTHESVQEGGT